MITNVGMIDICSKLELIKPIKKPNNETFDEKEKKELNSALSEIGFDIKTLKAA